MISYKEMLANIAKAIVDHPDEVAVAETDSDNGEITLVLSVAPTDMGKVIGKHGRIAKAIRSVIKAASNLDGDRVSVEIQ
ncbi:MAG: KH domain-containing protein [Clostridia bacterium]|nr:KH domain-containing protein [Clostridia bacterium]